MSETFDAQWQESVTVQFTLGDLMVMHAALTESITRIWVPELQEQATVASHTLLRSCTESATVGLCDRLLTLILDAAPDLAPTEESAP